MAAGPTRRAIPIGGAGRPPVGVQASIGVFPAAVASDGSRIKSVDLVISCPSGTPFPSSQRERLVPMPPAPSRPAQGVSVLRNGHLWLAATFAQMGDRSASAKSAELWRLEPGWTGIRALTL